MKFGAGKIFLNERHVIYGKFAVFEVIERTSVRLKGEFHPV